MTMQPEDHNCFTMFLCKPAWETDGQQRLQQHHHPWIHYSKHPLYSPTNMVEHDFSGGTVNKNLPVNAVIWVQFLVREAFCGATKLL